MSAPGYATLLQGLDAHDAMAAAVDDRTLEILARRRKTATVHRRGWLVRRMLVVADLAGLVLGALFAEWAVARHAPGGLFGARAEIVAFAASLPAWWLVAKWHGLYDGDEERTDHSTADDFVGVLHMITICTWLFAAGSHVTGMAHPGFEKLLIFWGGAIALVTFGRAAARAVARRSVTYLQNALIVGAGDVGQLIAKKLLQHHEYGINLVGFVDTTPKERRDDLEHLALLGGQDRLLAVVRLLDVERVIIAFSEESHYETLELIRALREVEPEIQIDIVPRLFESLAPNVMLHSIEGIPLMALPPVRLSRSSAVLKRTTDVVIALVGLVMLAPMLAAICVATWVDSGRPIFYRRRVMGRGGVEFDAFKFRTMRPEFCVGDRYGGATASSALRHILSDPDAQREYQLRHKLQNDPRITRLGHFLRRSSMDELPQLLNVLRGEMSIVGPRMITRDELIRYGDEAETLLSIRPGLTGYWQINGRSSVDYSDRVRLDLAYIGGWSMSLDIGIIFRTVRALVAARGAH